MEMGYKRVWAVFQPFTFSRTALLLDDFAEALSIADITVLTDIMGSREKNTFNIFTKDLGTKLMVVFILNRTKIKNLMMNANTLTSNRFVIMSVKMHKLVTL